MAPRRAGEVRALLVGLVAILALAATSFWPLLFSCAAEVFYVVVAASILAMAAQLRPLVDDDYPLFLGIALTFAAVLRLFHAATYPGIGIFHASDENLTLQFSLAARYISTVSLLVAPLMLHRRLRATALAVVYALVVALLILSIVVWKVFPACWVRGEGLTPFKVVSEYVEAALLAGAIALLVARRKALQTGTLRLMVLALGLSLSSNLAFTNVTKQNTLAAITGHLLAASSIYLILVAVVHHGIAKPTALLLDGLRDREQQALSEAQRSLAELHDLELREKALVDGADLGLLAFDKRLVISECNDRTAEIMGSTREALQGFDLKEVHDTRILRALRAAALEGRASSYEGPYRSTSGNKDLWISARTSPVFAPDGELSGGIALVADLTASRHTEELVERLAFRDPVTDLPNRALLRDRVRQAVDNAARGRRKVAVAVLDLDRFKNVNDTLGTGSADMVLQELAKRLGALIRRGDTLARTGGDEFSLLMPGVRASEDLVVVSTKILAACREPWQVDGHTFYTTASVGIALFPDNSDDAQDLLRNADTAMRKAKELGGDGSQFYEAAISVQAAERLAAERDLRRALDEEQFVVYYQPEIELATGRVVGVEALVRWRHPERGLVPPSEFIPLAEETGLIGPLDLWVIRRACEDVACGCDAASNLRLAVNVSARQLHSASLLPAIESALGASGLAASQLEIEITETAIMADPVAAKELLEAMRRRGLTVALDDFGTGFSSLSHLHQLPISRLKVDRSFVSRIEDDSGAAVIVSAVVNLAHNLGLGVIAEGVETRAQLAFLRDAGCEEAQGYLLARPMPIEDLRAMLRRDAVESTTP